MPTQAEIRRSINARLIEGLRAGNVPWVRPWSSDANCGFPKNVATKKSYRGVNPLLLFLTSHVRGYTSRWWGTYRQWRSLGGQVKRRPKDVERGDWGTTIVFCKQVRKSKISDDGEEQVESYRLLQSYTVFNLDQVDGDFDHLRPMANDSETVLPDYQRAQEVIDATDADIRMGGNRCSYFLPYGDWPNHTDGDFIRLPHPRQFADQSDYYASAFHELTHWTECRLNWKESYALGELRAEISACYLAAACSIPNGHDLENHNRYLASWLKELDNDDSVIFRAAAAASKASDYILSFSEHKEPVALIV